MDQSYRAPPSWKIVTNVAVGLPKKLGPLVSIEMVCGAERFSKVRACQGCHRRDLCRGAPGKSLSSFAKLACEPNVCHTVESRAVGHAVELALGGDMMDGSPPELDGIKQHQEQKYQGPCCEGKVFSPGFGGGRFVPFSCGFIAPGECSQRALKILVDRGRAAVVDLFR